MICKLKSLSYKNILFLRSYFTKVCFYLVKECVMSKYLIFSLVRSDTICFMTAELIYLFTFAHQMAITSAADLLDPISQSNHRETPCCCFYPDS